MVKDGSNGTDNPSSTIASTDRVIYFQDYFTTFTTATATAFKNSSKHNSTAVTKSNKRYHDGNGNGNGNGNGHGNCDSIDPAEAFFELANASKVGFRLASFLTDTSTDRDRITDKNVSTKQRNKSVVVTQDNGCEIHTGGIVWETAYLLALYLIHISSSPSPSPHRDNNSACFPLGKVLEVGAGCGMLGLILASLDTLCTKVVMTETNDVMPNLIANVNANIVTNYNIDHHNPPQNTATATTPTTPTTHTTHTPCCSAHRISAHQLCWTDPHRDIRISHNHDNDNDNNNNHDLTPHSFDTIVGTDVIFSTELVVPLLTTLRTMAHDTTQIYLCLQVRCAEAHTLLLDRVADFGFIVTDKTSVLGEMEGCDWGLQMDCKIFQLTRVSEDAHGHTHAQGDGQGQRHRVEPQKRVGGNGGAKKRKMEDTTTITTRRKQEL